MAEDILRGSISSVCLMWDFNNIPSFMMHPLSSWTFDHHIRPLPDWTQNPISFPSTSLSSFSKNKGETGSKLKEVDEDDYCDEIENCT